MEVQVRLQNLRLGAGVVVVVVGRGVVVVVVVVVGEGAPQGLPRELHKLEPSVAEQTPFTQVEEIPFMVTPRAVRSPTLVQVRSHWVPAGGAGVVVVVVVPEEGGGTPAPSHQPSATLALIQSR